jgi:hemoglobin
MKASTTLALVLAASCSLVACTDEDDLPDMSGTCTTQMYAKYGKDAFTAVNTKILKNVVQVSSINPSPIGDSFKGLTDQAVARVEANLLDFLIKVYGGPDNYKGEDMTTSHIGLNITSEQYDAFVGMVVVPALAASGVPNSDITNCFEIGRAHV